MNKGKSNPVYLYYTIGFVIATLIGIQVYWIRNSINAEKKAIERRLKEDIDDVVKRVEEDAYCFTYYSKAYIKKGEGIFMLKQKWADGRFVPLNAGGYVDTMSLYNLFRTQADTDVFIHDKSVWFDTYPATVDVTMKFSFVGLNPDIKRTDSLSYQIGNISDNNFRQLLSNKFKVDEAINTTLLNHLIVEALKKNKLDTFYYAGIRKEGQDGYEYITKGSKIADLKSTNIKASFLNNKFDTPYELDVHVPDSFMSVVRSLLIMMISSLLIIIILIASYIYFVRTIFNQKKLSEIKNNFINNITHEFRTPITNINLAVENWKDAGKPDNYYLNIIEEENKHMERNVEQILQLASLEERIGKKHFTKVNIPDLIKEAAASFQIQIDNTNGNIKLDLNASNPYLYCNALHVRNMLQNLIDNAIKYRKDKPIITISTFNTGSHYVLQVEDNGIGMSAETQKYIFNRFYRGDTGDRHDVKGFGLGMSYVKHIVDEHNGEINIKSKPGKGTKVTIYLPELNNH